MMSSGMQGQQHKQQQQEQLVVMKSSCGSSKCRDCGNQAKKDCGYSRCRTCCKNKGFQCQTHVRSTWIPVDRRRQRQLLMDPSSPIITPKRHHNYDIIDNNIPKRHKHNSYSSEEMKFPAAMSSVAIFSCVGVRSMDDTVNEIAYQTSVNIGGHIFSGILYDHGPHEHQISNNNNNNENSNNRHRSEGSTEHTTLVLHHHQQQQHNLNLMMMSDGATLPHSLPASATASGTNDVSAEQFFPLPGYFRPDMPYFSHYSIS